MFRPSVVHILIVFAFLLVSIPQLDGNDADDGVPTLEFINTPADGRASWSSEIRLYVSGSGTLEGQGTYPNFIDVTITATPFDDWGFIGWYVDDVLLSVDAEHTFAAEGDTDIVARFGQFYDVSGDVSGFGDIEGIGRYAIGTNAVLEAVPYTGYRLSAWLVDGVDYGNTNPLIITGEASVMAVFEPMTYTISVNIHGDGAVHGRNVVTHGGNVKLIPVPASGSAFWKWECDGIQYDGGNLILYGVTSDASYDLWFHPASVRVETHSDYGYCTESTDVGWGEGITLEAYSDDREFVGWFVDGKLKSTSSTLILEDLTEDVYCEAVFGELMCNVTLEKNCDGGIAMLDGIEVDHITRTAGSVVRLSAVSHTGYTFAGWYVDSKLVSNNASASITVSGVTKVQVAWSYPKNPSIVLDSIGPAPFYLHPELSSEAGVSSVSWSMTNPEGYVKHAYGLDASMHVRDMGAYGLTAEITYFDGTKRTCTAAFDVDQVVKTYEWRFQAVPDNSNRYNDTKGVFSYTFDRSWYEYYLDKEGESKLDNNVYVMAGYVTYDDEVIEDFARKLEAYVESKGCTTDYAKASAILKFVQHFSYAYDDDQFGVEEYYMYPATFLIKEWGDCEDHAFLYASLMKALGHKVLLLSGQGHCAVGLDMEGSTGTYYRYVSLVKYYYCETTASSAAGYNNYGYEDYGEIGDMGSKYNIYLFIPIPVM